MVFPSVKPGFCGLRDFIVFKITTRRRSQDSIRGSAKLGESLVGVPHFSFRTLENTLRPYY